MGAYTIPVSHGSSIGKYSVIKMHNILLIGEMSIETVYLYGHNQDLYTFVPFYKHIPACYH
jgi:hypothetical protein